MAASELLKLKHDDPDAYRAALARIEVARLDMAAPKRALMPMVVAEPVVESGLPTQAAGVKVHKADSRGRMARPRWDSDTVREIMDDALDYAPDPHFAKQTAISLGLQDWTLEVHTTGPDGRPTEDVDEAAQAEVEAFADRMFRAYGGGVQAMLEVGLDSVLRRGAIAVELDVSDSLDDVDDVDLVPPERIDFRVETEGNHRRVYPVYMPSGAGEPKRLPEATFAYIGAAPRIGFPHGASPFLPLIDTAHPAIQTRDNLERVGNQQGWSRLAFILDLDRVARTAPPDVVRGNADGSYTVLDHARFATYIADVRSDMESTAEDMYADDTWIMYNTVAPSSVGAKHASESFKPLEFTQVFDQDNIVACMGQPAIHGRNWGAALSTTGSVQWMVYALGLEGLRDIPKRAVEFALNAYLQIRGIRAHVALTFAPIQKSDDLVDAQAAEIRTRTILAQRDAGLIDDDEAATELTGHPATGATVAPEAPRTAPDALAAPGRVTPPSCDCGACEGVLDDRAEPFVPDAPNPQGQIEMAGQAEVDADDAARVVREFDKWARKKAPTFVGMLAAEVLAPDNARTRYEAVRGPFQGLWAWDVARGAYRYPPARPGVLGRLVPPDRVTRLMEQRLADRRGMAAQITDDLLGKRISVGEWQTRMAAQVRDAHLEARMLGVGGQNAMGAADYGAVGGRVGRQYQYLTEFSQSVGRGELSEAQIRNRAGSYLEGSVRGTYQRATGVSAVVAGYTQERNVLGIADHCAECEDLSSAGWQPINSLPLIGERTCRTHCACSIEYRHGEDVLE